MTPPARTSRPPRTLALGLRAAALLIAHGLASAAPAQAQSAPAAAAKSTPAAPSTAALPAPTPDQIARAKTLFDLGAKAYDSEQFATAIQAFVEAHRMSQRPGPIFSAAQAYRRIYANDRTNVEALTQAVRYYKEYVVKQKAGGRIAEAQQALRDLEPLLAAASAAPAGTPPPVAPVAALDMKPKTRLMVSSPTKGALASLDGGELADMPLFQELTPGPHKLRLVAEGYVDDEREIVAAEGQVYGLDIALRERPAFLTVRATEGAQVLVDGRPEGIAPLPKPIELTPGSHLVTLTRTGHQPYSAEIELRRDQKRPLDVTLERTSQRYVAFAMFGAAGLGAIGGAILTGLAYHEQAVALEIEDIKAVTNISDQQRASHEQAVANRDDLRAAAVASFGAAGLLALLGTALYAFDRPAPGLPITLRDDAPPKAPEARKTRKLDASVVPLVGPTGGGAVIDVKF